MVSLTEIAVVVLVCGGVFFAFVAAVGLLRLPDLYTRAHSASKSDTLGAVLTLAGVALVFGADVALAKTLFLLAFMFITNPTAAHAITRAAHDQGIEPWTVADRDTEVGSATVERGDTETEPEPAADGGTAVGDGTTVADDVASATDGDAIDAAADASADSEGNRADDDGETTRTGGDRS